MSSNVSRLCAWYASHCRNDWHEDHGVRIDTLDNPGWSLVIDLEQTDLENRGFEDVRIERSDQDWVQARKRDSKFEAFGGPSNLDEMIGIFLDWVG